MRPQVTSDAEKERQEYSDALSGLDILNLEDEFDRETEKADGLLHLIEEAMDTDYDLDTVAGPVVTAVNGAREAIEKAQSVAGELFNRLNGQNGEGKEADNGKQD